MKSPDTDVAWGYHYPHYDGVTLSRRRQSAIYFAETGSGHLSATWNGSICLMATTAGRYECRVLCTSSSILRGVPSEEVLSRGASCPSMIHLQPRYMPSGFRSLIQCSVCQCSSHLTMDTYVTTVRRTSRGLILIPERIFSACIDQQTFAPSPNPIDHRKVGSTKSWYASPRPSIHLRPKVP